MESWKRGNWLSFFEADPDDDWKPHRLIELSEFNPFLLMDLYIKSEKFRKAMDEHPHILIDGMLFPVDSPILENKNGKKVLTRDKDLLTRDDYVTVRYGTQMPYVRPGEVYMSAGNGRVLNVREPLSDSAMEHMKSFVFKDTGYKSFGELVEYYRKRKNITQSQLAAAIGLSDDRSLRSMEKSGSPQIGSVIALCVILNLYPDEGNELVKAAGYSFKEDPQGRAYRYIVNTLTQGSLLQINHFLIEMGLKPLTT